MPTIQQTPDYSLHLDINHTLINPAFNAYKLTTSHNVKVQISPLDSSVNARRVSSHLQLSFRQVQARVHHNHLTSGFQNRRSVVYLDEEYRVVQVSRDANVSNVSSSHAWF